MKSYSISFRLRRVSTEAAHVSVPITEEFLLPYEEEFGGKKLNVDKIVQAAIALGRRSSTDWRQEGEDEIQPHPLQTPPDSETMPS